MITDAADGLEERFAGDGFELCAQTAHVDVEEVGVDVVARRPDLVGDEGARKDAPLVLQEDLEERIFAAGEIDRLAVHLYGVAEQVEPDAGVLEHRLLHGRVPADEGPDAREQLLAAEGLGHVVVGADVEPLHPIPHRVAGAEDEDRLAEAARAPLLEEIDPVAVGQPEIEDHQIEGRLGDRVGSVLAGADPPRRVAAFVERGLQEFTEPELIFDDQHFHGIPQSERSGTASRGNPIVTRLTVSFHRGAPSAQRRGPG